MNDIPFKKVVTIVTIVYNSCDSIEKTIQSVLSQDYSNIEYIVIDGGSTDGTKKIIERYSNRISKYVSEKDNGIFDAMNKGLLLAEGEYINFMNAGDYFVHSEVISLLCTKLNKGYDLIYGDTIKIINTGEKYCKASPFWVKKGIQVMGICHQSIFVRVNLAKSIMFDTNLNYSADYKMIFSIVLRKPMILYLNKPISKFNAIDGVSTINYIKTFREIITFYYPSSKIQRIVFLIKSTTIFYLYTLLKKCIK